MNRNMTLLLVFLAGVVLAGKVRSIPVLDKLPAL